MPTRHPTRVVCLTSVVFNAADRVLLRGTPFMIRLAMGLGKPKHPISDGSDRHA